MRTAYREDSESAGVNLSLAAFTALGSLCENSCQDSYPALYNKLLPILQALEEATKSAQAEQKALDLQDYLCGILQVILVKVGRRVSKEEAPKIVELIINIF